MENYSNIWAMIKNGKVIDTIVFNGEEPTFIEGLKYQGATFVLCVASAYSAKK
jgi:hypothetical protein